MKSDANDAFDRLADKAVRDKAFNNLRLFLSSRDGDLIEEKEMVKLWKGLFFCAFVSSSPSLYAHPQLSICLGFWHSDKPLVQQALATDFANLLLTITSIPTSFQFLKGFWQMIVEQWNKIDHFRSAKMFIYLYHGEKTLMQSTTDWTSSTCSFGGSSMLRFDCLSSWIGRRSILSFMS